MSVATRSKYGIQAEVQDPSSIYNSGVGNRTGMDKIALGMQIIQRLKKTVHEELEQWQWKPLTLQPPLELLQRLSHRPEHETRMRSIGSWQPEGIDRRAQERDAFVRRIGVRNELRSFHLSGSIGIKRCDLDADETGEVVRLPPPAASEADGGGKVSHPVPFDLIQHPLNMEGDRHPLCNILCQPNSRTSAESELNNRPEPLV